jgi:CheY-like chemotaxis protein
MPPEEPALYARVPAEMADDAVKPFKGEPRTNTIVVVEPDILARIVLGEYLRECGYKVLECANADDVLIILAAGRRIDVVLSEIDLGGEFDGFHLARQIRETHPTVEVLLTADPANAADKAGELCDEGPLEKPYHPRDVIRRLNRLRERRLRTQS